MGSYRKRISPDKSSYEHPLFPLKISSIPIHLKPYIFPRLFWSFGIRKRCKHVRKQRSKRHNRKKEEFKPCNTDQSELFVVSCRRRGGRHESVCIEKPLLNQLKHQQKQNSCLPQRPLPFALPSAAAFGLSKSCQSNGGSKVKPAVHGTFRRACASCL